MKRAALGVGLAAILGAALWSGLPGGASADDKKPAGKDKAPGPPPETQPRRIPLAAQATTKPASALQYSLLPPLAERTPGNAALLWNLAGQSAQAFRSKVPYEKVDNWGSALGTPLKDLPRKEVEEYLATCRSALRLARLAARRESCDWQPPALTAQSLQDYWPFEGLTSLREIARFLGVQYRLQLSVGRYDEASETLQTGFALARHLGDSDTLIQNLVGIAIAAIMIGHVEEWLQTPGSPNLYWPLTALPQPLLDVRRCTEYELNTYYRSFPQFREVRKAGLTAQHVEDLLDQANRALCKTLEKEPQVMRSVQRLMAAAEAARLYPKAKRHLLDLGRPAKEVEAMPVNQVAILYRLDEYDRVRDDVLKSLALPSWQGRPLLEQIDRQLRANRENSNPFLVLLAPAIFKTAMARVRLERQLAGLRCAEALRLYAAKHEGKPPAKWSDITTVPLPIDPLTGKGFDSFFQMRDGRGVLEIPPPPPPGMPASLGRRYELAPSR